MKNKISSNDILIIRNTIIWSGHDNGREYRDKRFTYL